MSRRPTLRFSAFERSWLILGLREGDTAALQRIVYLGNGHTMGRDSFGEYFSTRIGKNKAFSHDSIDAVPYLEGIARLGGLDRKTVARFKAQKEARARQQHESYAAFQILKCWPDISSVVTMTPATRRILQKLANKK